MESQDTLNQHVTAKHLAKTSGGAILGALLSRISGVLRTLVVNAVFGANTALDTFNAAFRFPNSLRDLFADGALSAAFMKVLVDAEPKGLAEQRRLISIIMGFFICITLLLAIIAAFYAEPFMRLISNNAFAQRGGLQSATLQFQILVFYLPLTMLNAVAMAILGVRGQTFRAMNSALFLSVGMIIGALLLAPLLAHWHFPAIMGLAAGAMLGALLQLFYQMQPLFGARLMPVPNFNPRTWWSYQPLREVLLLMTPRALGQGAMVLALMINTFFAVQIGPGALTYVATAVIIVQVPIGLFGVASGFAALPVLSAAILKREPQKFSWLLTESLRSSMWLAGFTAWCFALLMVPLYMLVFQHGKITFNDTIQNCIAVSAYAMGIVFAAGDKVLVNALYAVNATRQIVYNSIIYLLVNASLSALLAPRLGLLGLGISFGCATTIDFWLNYFVIKRAFRRRNFSISPYIMAGNYFGLRNLAAGLMGFLLGLLGVWLTGHFWRNFAGGFSHWTILFIIMGGGAILLLLFISLVLWGGPAPLQKMIKSIGLDF